MEIKKYEINLAQDVNQEQDEPLDTVNDILHTMFGTECDIDWRDSNTVWITTTQCQIIELSQ